MYTDDRYFQKLKTSDKMSGSVARSFFVCFGSFHQHQNYMGSLRPIRVFEILIWREKPADWPIFQTVRNSGT